MPKIILKRNSEWANKMRTFDLYLNGKKFTAIKDKGILSYDIPVGKYQLIAKIDWCASQPVIFDLEEGDIRRFEIKGFIFSKYLLPITIFFGLLYFGLYLKFGINSLIVATIMMALFGYFLFFITFGRNHYLRINEI